MTLKTIMEGLALNVGLQVPDEVIASSEREWQEAVKLSNIVGEELARRVDWGELQSTQTLTGDGTNQTFDLGSYFSRISPGIGVRTSSGDAVRPLTRAEWNALDPVEGTPRYFLLEGEEITLWPYLATSDTVTVSGQTRAWSSGGTDQWASDDDTALISEALMLKALIVRWRRQKGMDYADYEAEYEATLAQVAEFNERSRL